MSSDILVITHKNCPDGISAYCIIKSKYNKVNLIQVNAGDLLPFIDIFYDIIYVTDISFSKSEMLILTKCASQVFLFDHHKTAFENLNNWNDKPENLNMVIKMDKCGSAMTWEQIYPNEKMPSVLEYVNDQDMWKWEKKSSKQINTALSHDKYFENLIVDQLFDLNDQQLEDLFFEKGNLILIEQKKQIQELVEKSYDVKFNDMILRITDDCPPELKSDVGSELAQKSKSGIGGSKKIIDNHVQLSFRALTESNIDLTECIGAKGHKKAAGLTLPLEEYIILFQKV